MIKAVIFDMDGVLVDSYPAWFHNFNYLRKAFGFSGISDSEYRKKAWSRGTKAVMNPYFPGCRYEDVSSASINHFKRFLKYVDINQQSHETLKKISEKRLKIGLVSNTHKPIINLIFKHYRLNKYFDVVISADDVKKEKPDPEGLLKCIEKLKVKKNEVVYIGDAIYDEMAAKRARVKFVGYRRGKPKILQLRSLLNFLE